MVSNKIHYTTLIIIITQVVKPKERKMIYMDSSLELSNSSIEFHHAQMGCMPLQTNTSDCRVFICMVS